LTQTSTCTLFVEGLLVKCTKDITCVECEWEDYVGEGRMNREQCCVAGLLSALPNFNLLGKASQNYHEPVYILLFQ
jgi:hypothetical protein